jgi:CubicO group peptidase (beta-lactamase class C family)
VSFLIGTALEDGDIRSLDDPVDEYVPKLKKGGYRGVRINDVLQMSSGIRWNENYGSLSSDVVRSAGVMMAGDLDEFVATRKPSRDHEPGTHLQYKSADTHVLGMVLEVATGQPFHLYASDKLWSRLGAEDDAKLQVDAEWNPVVMGGISMRVRDMARFGQLYLDRGRNLRGEPLLKDPKWIDESTSLDPDAAHLQPASTNPDFDSREKKYPFGYAYQWWIPDPPQGDFCAIGIYGQFIYVNPQYRVVIAKTSAFPTYADKIKNDKRNLTYGDEMEIESMPVFRTIAEGLK